jgi:hypothetical protein
VNASRKLVRIIHSMFQNGTGVSGGLLPARRLLDFHELGGPARPAVWLTGCHPWRDTFAVVNCPGHLVGTDAIPAEVGSVPATEVTTSGRTGCRVLDSRDRGIPDHNPQSERATFNRELAVSSEWCLLRRIYALRRPRASIFSRSASKVHGFWMYKLAPASIAVPTYSFSEFVVTMISGSGS